MLAFAGDGCSRASVSPASWAEAALDCQRLLKVEGQQVMGLKDSLTK